VAVSIDPTSTFEQHRRLLFAIAYRMLGSASDAEDVVQDAYLRWHGARQGEIRDAKAFLTTATSRLCLDRLKSARRQRETYIGPWLPEPVLTPDLDVDPASKAERRDDVSFALLVTLERLTPPERAVYVLHEAFGFPHREIADQLAISVVASRQMLHRAHAHIETEQTRFSAASTAHEMLVERFLEAAGTGNVQALTDLFTEDVTSWSDGGGVVSAARKPIHGRAPVVRFLAGLRALAPDTLRLESLEVNGGPAVAAWLGPALLNAMVFEVSADSDHISRLWIVVNPTKLDYLRRQLNAEPLDWAALMPGRR
jgi:RNA polymerase sigma-70 factor (ECF subfamily)